MTFRCVKAPANLPLFSYDASKNLLQRCIVIFTISLASWNASSVKKTLQSMLIPIQGELFLLRFSATCLLTKLREKLEEKMASVNRACTGYMWFAPRFDWLMFRLCVRLGG